MDKFEDRVLKVIPDIKYSCMKGLVEAAEEYGIADEIVTALPALVEVPHTIIPTFINAVRFASLYHLSEVEAWKIVFSDKNKLIEAANKDVRPYASMYSNTRLVNKIIYPWANYEK